MALVASAMLASCGQATPQVGDQSWTTDQPTQLCVDQQGNRVPESECANQRVRTGYRPNYLWYYMMRGNRVPAYGEHIAVGQGSYQPVAATRYTPASTVETDLELLQRLLRRIQNPQRGGTAADYRFWAENAFNVLTGAPLGIVRFYVYPLRDGLATINGCATVDGYDMVRDPGATLISDLQDWLDKQRPVTAVVTAYRPEMQATRALRLRVIAQPSTAKNSTYVYDWDDQRLSTTITAHTSNSVTVAAIPPKLQAAYTAGKKPRIQVIISTAGASPIPFVARVINITGLVLTLDTTFSVPPSNAVDYFYAGSATVVPIATRLREYVKQLGPSRASGTADPDDPWEDTIRLERIVDIVMETKDTDGTRMVTSMQPYATCVQTAIGAGAFASVDRTPRDIRAGVGPELLFLRAGGIEVIQ
jgi:hypothetical protein